jgi:hypothetical protein
MTELATEAQRHREAFRQTTEGFAKALQLSSAPNGCSRFLRASVANSIALD